MRQLSLFSQGMIVAALLTLPLTRAGVAGQAPAAQSGKASSGANLPRTPWGEPDLQGIWTADALAGVPLERPSPAATALTKEEAAKRRAAATGGLDPSREGLGSYGWEFRDIAPAFAKTIPSTQVSMVIDPPDGKVPALTPEGQRRFAEREKGSRQNRSPHSWTDQGTWDRCITRGLPNIMMPLGYNNNVQILQSPGYVVIVHEMIHEPRIIPTDARPHLGPKLRQWLGDPRGRWEGDTLVVDITNFNGKQLYTPAVAGGAGNVQASRAWDSTFHLTERFTRVDAHTIDYRVTINDPTIWTKPFTLGFPLTKDDTQYELVEYACHEANYGLQNILSAARAEEKAAARKDAKPR
jgi:hypothetical protein